VGFGDRLWIVRLRIFFVKTTPLFWGFIIFSPPFLSIFNVTYVLRWGSIYSLDTINSGAVFQKQHANPFFNCLNTILRTLVNSFLLIIGHLSNTYEKNLNMSNFIYFLSKNDDLFWNFFIKNPSCKWESFLFPFPSKIKFIFRF
jgi:hypothetical protein